MILNTFNVQRTIEELVGGFYNEQIVDYSIDEVQMSFGNAFDVNRLCTELSDAFPQADFEFEIDGNVLTISW